MRISHPPSAILSALINALFLVALALAAVALLELRASAHVLEHMGKVRFAIDDLRASVVDTETGERGYVITGNAKYLEPYNAGKAEVSAATERLRSLTADNPGQKERLDEIERLVGARMDMLRTRIDARDRGGFPAAAALVATGEGERTTQLLRADLATMSDVEERMLVKERVARERDGVFTLASLVIASTLFGLLTVRGMVQRRLRAERERNAEFQERFVAILGHDLRTPLASIVTNTELLRRTATPQQANALRRLKSSSERMGRMIDQLLDLARIRLGGGIRIAAAPVDLRKLVDGIADELRVSQPEGAIHVEGDDGVEGLWDKDRLEQVVSNLLGNALAYREPSAPILVGVHAREDLAELVVHNDGPPIPLAVMPALFDPFRRGEHQARQAATAGLGLGLFITKELVAAHGGSIAVHSADDGSGTTFTVTLPRRRDAQNVLKPPPLGRLRANILRVKAPAGG